MTDHQAADEDYRKSHLQRGGTYDATLAATPFDKFMGDVERELLLELVPSLFPIQKPRYLDFACGTARITQTVAPLCREAVAVDISPSMLAEAKLKCPTVKFVHADLTKEGVDLGKFDLVTSFRFFGNAQDELRMAVLRALNRTLNINGFLVINSHRNPHAISALLGNATGGNHGMDLTYFKLKRLLTAHGFAIKQTRPIGFSVYRSKMMMSSESLGRAKGRESIFKSEIFTPFAPDAIVVAQKIRAL